MIEQLQEKDLDDIILDEILRYARMISAEGHVGNTLGNVAVRGVHPKTGEHIAYTKRAGISLGQMGAEDIAVTSIPEKYEEATRAGELLFGQNAPSVGHQLNLEVFRYRPDIAAIIHVHPEVVFAYSAAGHADFKYISADLPLVMGKPVHVLPSDVNVEMDVAKVKDFIQDTNAIILLGHGVTTLGRKVQDSQDSPPRYVAEAYHRLNTLVRDLRAYMLSEISARLRGKQIMVIPQGAVEEMFRMADRIIYPYRSGR